MHMNTFTLLFVKLSINDTILVFSQVFGLFSTDRIDLLRNLDQKHKINKVLPKERNSSSLAFFRSFFDQLPLSEVECCRTGPPRAGVTCDNTTGGESFRDILVWTRRPFPLR